MQMMIKNEQKNKKRNCMSMAEGEFQVVTKRRRKEPVAAPLTSEVNQSQKQQVDQNYTTSTTKRSSRFRGVSR